MDRFTTFFDHAPLVVYILALTLTPGPSSLLIASSGARFGLARCVPHLAGALIGFELQLANPKPWLTAAASAGLFLPATAPLAKKGAFLLCAGGAGVVGLAAWGVAGMALQRWLGSAASRQAALNRALALALMAAALFGLVDAYAALPLPRPDRV